MAGAPNRGLFHSDHPRRLIPELSAEYHRNGWFVGNGYGGFISIKQGDSAYVAPSNVVKNRIEAEDLFAYKIGTATLALSPSQDRKLSPCEIISSILVVFKERKSAAAVLHSNGKAPCLASLVYPRNEFRIKNQTAITGIYNDGLKRNYNLDEELIVPITNLLTEAELKRVLKKYPHTNAVIVRNQGMFVWGETWQKCQSMAETYHFLMDVALQMEKLGLNVYTHETASSDVVAMNNSISAAVNADTEEELSASPQLPSTRAATSSPAKASASPPSSSSTVAATPSSSSSPSKSSDGKKGPTKANEKTAAKTSPLKKTAGGKVTKAAAAASSGKGRGRGRGGPTSRGRGNLPRASPGRNGPGFGPPGPGPIGSMGPPPIGMMMGPPPMGGPIPMGVPPPMGPPLMGMGHPMAPPPMGLPPMRGPMMRRGPPSTMRGGGGKQRGRGGGGKKAGSVRGGKKQKNNKAGMAKDVLMNY